MSAISELTTAEREAVFAVVQGYMHRPYVVAILHKLVEDKPLDDGDRPLVLTALNEGVNKDTSLSNVRLYKALIARLS